MGTPFPDTATMFSCLNSLHSHEPSANEQKEADLSESLLCNCEEAAEACSRCNECNEILCSKCVKAHKRVKLTKDHCILPIEEDHQSPSSSSSSNRTRQSNSPSSLLNGNFGTTCDLHLTETLKLYCDSCNVFFCQECNSLDHRAHKVVYIQEAFDCAQISSMKLLKDVKMNAEASKECLNLSQRLIDTINIRSQSTTNEIRNIMRRFHMAIEERERELVAKVEKIRVMKYKALQRQIESYRSLFSCYMYSSKALSDALENIRPLELLKTRDHISAEMKRLLSVRANLPHVDDSISVIPPNSSLLFAISSMIDISAPGFSPGAIGEEMVRNCGKSIFQNNNHSNLNVLSRIINNIPSVTNYQEKPFPEASRFSLWTNNFVAKEGPLQILRTPRLRINGAINTCRDYTLARDPVLIIGGEGEEDGQLCRPWGVCCTPEGNIVVADRSNNRIQIFKSDGSFINKFGSHGKEPGYFDRPAGVAIDPYGRLVITDKDNHRIQIFTQNGMFIFTFGEKGSKICQFNYPWDVDVDSRGRIVVSDTRNHRIQMFGNDGSFIAKYGFDSSANMVKHFDSPRGVCFGPRGSVIVTDFNNHRIVIVDTNLRHAKFLGVEGCGMKQLLRPQGIVVDPAGNIIIADSRNNRVQILELDGTFISEIGTTGTEPGQMDRPSGVCLSPNGKIIVVDFGNNRVQVF